MEGIYGGARLFSECREAGILGTNSACLFARTARTEKRETRAEGKNGRRSEVQETRSIGVWPWKPLEDGGNPWKIPAILYSTIGMLACVSEILECYADWRGQGWGRDVSIMGDAFLLTRVEGAQGVVHQRETFCAHEGSFLRRSSGCKNRRRGELQ